MEPSGRGWGLDTHALAAPARHGIERHVLVGEVEVGGEAIGLDGEDGVGSFGLGLQDEEFRVRVKGRTALGGKGKVRGVGQRVSAALQLCPVDNPVSIGLEYLVDGCGDGRSGHVDIRSANVPEEPGLRC